MPLDLVINRQLNLTKFFLDKHFSGLSRWMFDYTIEGYSKKSFPNLDPSWRLSPAPSLANHQPVISDNLVNSLREQKITSVQGIKRFLGDKQVELSDGTKLEVDTVVFCTGYEPDFSLFRDYDPLAPTYLNSFTTSNVNSDKVELNSQEPRLAHLYQNIFPPAHASSLAFFNYAALTDGAMTVIDLVSMAVSQVWKPTNPYLLPSPSSMEKSIKAHHAWVRSLTRNGTDTVYTGIVRPGPYFRFLNEVAGTGVDDFLGWGRKGWGFWWRDRKMRGVMMTGVMSPFMYRFFDMEGKGKDGKKGSRKRWEGAKEAILHANELAKAYKH